MASSDEDIVGEQQEEGLLTERRPARWARPAALAVLGLAACCGLAALALRAPAERVRPWDPQDVEVLTAALVKATGRAPTRAELGLAQRHLGRGALGRARMAFAAFPPDGAEAEPRQLHGRGRGRDHCPLSGACKRGFRAHFRKIFERVTTAIFNVAEKCVDDNTTSANETESTECQDAADSLDSLEDDLKSECGGRGELCTATETVGDDSDADTVCIPKDCHGELQELADFAEQKGWTEAEGAELSISCPAPA